jgi:hypothetical protein
MPITLENLAYSRKRNPQTNNSIVIPWNKIEGIIYGNVRRMVGGEDAASCLKAIDEEITGLMDVYGHFYRG